MKHHKLKPGDRIHLYPHPHPKETQRWVIVEADGSQTTAYRIDDGREGPHEHVVWTDEWVAKRLAAGHAHRDRDGRSADLSVYDAPDDSVY